MMAGWNCGWAAPRTRRASGRSTPRSWPRRPPAGVRGALDGRDEGTGGGEVAGAPVAGGRGRRHDPRLRLRRPVPPPRGRRLVDGGVAVRPPRRPPHRAGPPAVRGAVRAAAHPGLRPGICGIALPNDASVGLHEALGFVPVGVYRSVGWKFGAWHDVGWWQMPPQAVGAPPRPVRPLDATSQGASEDQSAKPEGSWRPMVPCSNRPQPSTPSQVARPTWSTTLKGTRPATAGSVMS